MSLTPEQVLTATVGPELDRLVVECVCGWQPMLVVGKDTRGFYHRADGSPLSILPRYRSLLWSPSTCSRAADELVDLMQAGNYSFALWQTPLHASHLPGIFAAFRHGLRHIALEPADPKAAYATGLTRPEAIARAALMAKALEAGGQG